MQDAMKNLQALVNNLRRNLVITFFRISTLQFNIIEFVLLFHQFSYKDLTTAVLIQE